MGSLNELAAMTTSVVEETEHFAVIEVSVPITTRNSIHVYEALWRRGYAVIGLVGDRRVSCRKA